MSAECYDCGSDLVYPAGKWPVGECPVCTIEAERDALAAWLDEAEEALREANEAGRAITASLIVVKHLLDAPYPDDERWTPWTRFIERDLTRLESARAQARAVLSRGVPADEQEDTT